jgi:hypothetical protein
MNNDLDSVIKLDRDFYNEHFQKKDFYLRDSANFKSYEWYERFAKDLRGRYNLLIQNLQREGVSQEEIAEAKERYRDELKKYLHPTAKLSHEDPVDTVLRTNLHPPSLDELLKESALEKIEGANLYRIKLGNLIIEGKTAKEVNTTYKNFKTSFEYLGRSNSEVELALRQRLYSFRQGGPDPSRPIATCIRAAPDSAQISRWEIQERGSDVSLYRDKSLYPDNMQVVEWNQEEVGIDKYSRDTGLSTLSPAVVLAHELEHAFHCLCDQIGQFVRRNIADISFGDMEEKRVICGIEKTLNINLGVNPRVGYSGWVLSTTGVTSREPMLKIREEDEFKCVPEFEITGNLTREGAKQGEIGIKIKKENGESDKVVFLDRIEMSSIISMNRELSFPGKTHFQILEDAIAHGDAVTLHLKKDAYINGGLPTMQNPAQLKRFREPTRKLEKDSIRPKAGQVYREIDPATKGKRLHKVSPFPPPGNPASLTGANVQLSLEKGRALERRKRAVETRTMQSKGALPRKNEETKIRKSVAESPAQATMRASSAPLKKESRSIFSNMAAILKKIWSNVFSPKPLNQKLALKQQEERSARGPSALTTTITERTTTPSRSKTNIETRNKNISATRPAAFDLIKAI